MEHTPHEDEVATDPKLDKICRWLWTPKKPLQIMKERFKMALSIFITITITKTMKIWTILYITLYLFEININVDVFSTIYKYRNELNSKFQPQSLKHIQILQWLDSRSNRTWIELQIASKIPLKPLTRVLFVVLQCIMYWTQDWSHVEFTSDYGPISSWNQTGRI